MPSYDRKLNQFISTIITDASQESTQILKEIETKKSSHLEAAENDLLNEMYNYIRVKTAEARTEAGRRISKRALENKKTLFAYRSGVTQKVLDDVKKRIGEYVLTTEYLSSLEKLAAYAAAALNCGDLRILLREADLRHADHLKAGIPAEYLPAEIKLGGLIAVSPSKNLRIDLSYDASFGEVADKFGEISGFGI